ncbi:MAG: DUF3737 family protein [Clostridia bacterium]|nr:DUF3737 family protein [Clostridia bacterium]
MDQRKHQIEDAVFDSERALYASEDLLCARCTFAGEADGESAFKESRGVTALSCHFALRYPFWHDDDVIVRNSVFTDTCRAPFWYSKNICMHDSTMASVKAFRECENIEIENCRIHSSEFGWNCRNLRLLGGEASSEYYLFGAEGVYAENHEFSGKYSFQYVKNAELHHCILNTKDAFWHAENVVVYDSVVSGEYLGWYSKNLRLVRCRISGTQPLCYAEGLVLEDCTMEGCDLSFEYSSVDAVVRGEIMSVKNPLNGQITADRIGEVIFDEHRRHGAECVITVHN